MSQNPVNLWFRPLLQHFTSDDFSETSIEEELNASTESTLTLNEVGIGALPIEECHLRKARELVNQLNQDLIGCTKGSDPLIGFELSFTSKPNSNSNETSLSIRCVPQRVGIQRFPKSWQEIERFQHVRLLRVQPKINGTRWLSLLGIAQNWPLTWYDDVELDEEKHDFYAVLIHAYRGALNRLFQNYGGLHQAHEHRDEILQNRLRGQLQVGRYLQKIATGKPSHVPCRFSGLRLDCLPNQALLAALRVAQRLQHFVETPTKRNLPAGQRSLLQLEHSFAGISHRRVPPSELRNLRLPGAFSGYRESGALELARLLLSLDGLHEFHGINQAPGISINMPKLFEEAFASLVAHVTNQKNNEIAQQSWRYSFHSDSSAAEVSYEDTLGQTRLYPDVFIQNQAIVIDTKWKPGLAEDSGSTISTNTGTNIRVYSSDLMQIAAYTQIATIRCKASAVGVLVFPTTTTMTEPFPIYAEETRLPLYVAGWNVTSQDLYTEGRKLVEMLLALSTKHHQRRS